MHGRLHAQAAASYTGGFIARLQRSPHRPQNDDMKLAFSSNAYMHFSIEDTIRKLEYDLFYVRHVGPLMDLQIILRTFRVILWSAGDR